MAGVKQQSLIRARLLGGKVNKAKKGELRFPLPVGYCYDAEGHTILDPDEQVREVIALLFRLFKQQGTAYAVAHYFSRHHIQFPKRAWGCLERKADLGTTHFNPSPRRA